MPKIPLDDSEVKQKPLSRPEYIPPIKENIPEELKTILQWVLWRAKLIPGHMKNGKWVKDNWTKPLYSINGSNASSTDPRTWTTFEKAWDSYARGNFDGVGLVLTADTGIIGVDLDDCVKNKIITPAAQKVVDLLDSYTEISPSGEGLRIFCRGTLPFTGRNKDGVEIYGSLRYLTMTGEVLRKAPVASRQAEIDTLSEKIFGVDWKKEPASSCINDVPDAEWWDGSPASLPIPDRIKDIISGVVQTNPDDRSPDSLTVTNWLVYCRLSNAQIYQVFAENPIGEKSREKANPEGWIDIHIRKSRARSEENNWYYTDPRDDFSPVCPSDQPWEPIISLHKPAPLAFAKEDFPSELWGMIEAVSKDSEVPTELPGLLALGVVAASVQKKFWISPKKGYEEPLNIFCNVVLPPGERKSGALKHLTAPLLAWEIQQARRIEITIKEAVLTRACQDARTKSLQSRYAKEKDPIKREAIQNEMLLHAQDLVCIPTAPQLWTQDCTPERLGVLLSENGEKMAVLSAEGGIFDIIAGRYSNGTPNLDVFLQGHAGDAVRVDRASREPVYLEAPALTMILSTQPDVLQSMTEKKGFRGRGLIARFLYALPTPKAGKRALDACPIPESISQEYTRMVSSLLEKNPSEGPLIIDGDAHTIWKSFAHEVERGLADGGKFEYMKDWAGKLPGAAARIAGIFHCIKFADGDPATSLVGKETMLKAVSLSKKLVSHALAVYDVIGADEGVNEAKKVLNWVRLREVKNFSIRECHNSLQHIFPKSEYLIPAIKILSERGYIRKELPAVGKKGGRPSSKYSVNPSVFSGGF